MRTTFINELLNHAENDTKIALLIGDLGYSVVDKFADSLPNQFVNVGIAEQNMAGIAAGMASEGQHVSLLDRKFFDISGGRTTSQRHRLSLAAGNNSHRRRRPCLWQSWVFTSPFRILR